MCKLISDIKPMGFWQRVFNGGYCKGDVDTLINKVALLNNEVTNLNLEIKNSKNKIMVTEEMLFREREAASDLAKETLNEIGDLNIDIADKEIKLTESTDINTALRKKLDRPVDCRHVESDFKVQITNLNTQHLAEIKELNKAIENQSRAFDTERRSAVKTLADSILKTDRKTKKDPVVKSLQAELEEANKRIEELTTKTLPVSKGKLTCMQVNKMKSDRKSGKTLVVLGLEYSLDPSTIARIVKGITYKNC